MLDEASFSGASIAIALKRKRNHGDWDNPLDLRL